MQNNDTKQIVGAIVLAGAMIAGAIVIRGGSTSSSSVPSIAKQVNLSTRSFNKCLADAKFKSKVEADADDGVKAGVNGTPSSYILKDGKAVTFIASDGKTYDAIPGAQPYEVVSQNIKRILENEAESKPAPIRAVTADDHILGDINTAKLVIVEYSDLECPFCKAFHSTMHQVMDENKGEIAWVYRHFPLTQIHPKAMQAALASECAWDQGGNEAFWKYADKVFEAGLQTNTF